MIAYGTDYPPAVDPDEDLETARDAAFQMAVDDELRRLRVREAARKAFAAEQRPDHDVSVDEGLLEDILARPTEQRWAVDDLLPAGGRMLLAAQRKTGKTVAALNYVRARLTGEPLFGRFNTHTLDGRIGFLNYEVDGAQVARWAADLNIPRRALYLINLRGRRNLLADDEGRAELVGLLTTNEVAGLVVDPFGRAYTGKSQNDSAEVTPWLVRLDEVATRAGCHEVLLTAHAGWDGERTRGSSALEDWPDVIVTMTRDTEDRTRRYLRAEGRDVEVDEDELSFDPETRVLTLTGSGSRKQAKHRSHLDELKAPLRQHVAAHPGVTTSDLIRSLRSRQLSFQDRDVSHAARLLAEEGLVRIEDLGRGRPKKHYINTPSNPVQTLSTDAPPTPRPTPSIGGRGRGGRGTHLNSLDGDEYPA